MKFEYFCGFNFLNLCDLAILKRKCYETQPYRNYCKSIIIRDEDIKKKYIDFIKLKKAKVIFVKADCLKWFHKKIVPLIKYKFILLSHFSDYTLGGSAYSYILKNNYLISWFSTNMKYGERNYSIPIGLPYIDPVLSKVPNSHKEIAPTNFNVLDKYKNNNKSELLYFNFNLNTYSGRILVENVLIKNGFIKNKAKKWEDFIYDLSCHKFCASPRGNGIDCYRTWEALYLGCIPIVEKNDEIYSSVSDLPILWVNNFDIVTPEFLNEQYDIFKNKNFNYEKLNFSYWKNKIYTIRSII